MYPTDKHKRNGKEEGRAKKKKSEKVEMLA